MWAVNSRMLSALSRALASRLALTAGWFCFFSRSRRRLRSCWASMPSMRMLLIPAPLRHHRHHGEELRWPVALRHRYVTPSDGPGNAVGDLDGLLPYDVLIERVFLAHVVFELVKQFLRALLGMGFQDLLSLPNETLQILALGLRHAGHRGALDRRRLDGRAAEQRAAASRT